MTTTAATMPFPARLRTELRLDPVLLTIVTALLLGGFVILASASPRRRELLAQLAIPFTVIPADIDEQQLPGETPRDYVVRVSRAKACHRCDG